MFGLFKYTYDYYEWQDLICVSSEKDNLIEFYNGMTRNTDKLVEHDGEERARLRECEAPYYTIEPVDVV